MKKEIVIAVIRSTFLGIGIILATKWTGLEWWKSWILFTLFATSATFDIRRNH